MFYKHFSNEQAPVFLDVYDSGGRLGTKSVTSRTGIISTIIVTRNNIVWKLACGYCFCYCKTFSLVPDSAEFTKKIFSKRAIHYFYHLKLNNIISQKKIPNTEKHFYQWLISFNLKLSCTWLILVNSKDLL